jgi:hypothetical protein
VFQPAPLLDGERTRDDQGCARQLLSGIIAVAPTASIAAQQAPQARQTGAAPSASVQLLE